MHNKGRALRGKSKPLAHPAWLGVCSDLSLQKQNFSKMQVSRAPAKDVVKQEKAWWESLEKGMTWSTESLETRVVAHIFQTLRPWHWSHERSLSPCSSPHRNRMIERGHQKHMQRGNKIGKEPKGKERAKVWKARCRRAEAPPVSEEGFKFGASVIVSLKIRASSV